MKSTTVIRPKELFMTMNNVAWRSNRFPRVSAFIERTALQKELMMSAVVVSSSTWPTENVTLWIAVIGKQMTRDEVRKTLSALGWIFREFTELKQGKM